MQVTDEKGNPAPSVTPDVKSRSDATFQKLFGQLNRSMPKEAKEPTERKEAKELKEAKEQVKAQEQAKEAKPAQEPEPDMEPGTNGEVPEDIAKRVAYFEERAKSFQSKYDKLVESIKGKKPIDEEEYNQLVSAKQKVDEFVKDPVSFVLNNFPELGKQLASAGDPVKMIETEVADYRDKLLAEFRKNYGQDWEFNALEAETPGTPSFRFRLAILEKMDEARGRYREQVEQARRSMQEIERNKAEDIKRLKSEFGITDEDIKKAEEILSNTKISYYNLVKLALLDDIIQKKLSSMPLPPNPAPDLTVIPQSTPKAAKPEKLSDGTKLVISRLGRRVIS